MSEISLLKLYLLFVKIGAILIGGGYVILPIVTNEFVDKQKLISREEILDYFALAQSLPGIIAANISMFIGYKLKGKSGAFFAMLGIITIPFLCIVLLASILSMLTSNIYIHNALWGIGIAVIALITLTIKEMWQNTDKDFFFYLIFITGLVFLIYLEFSPIKTILILTSLGILYKRFLASREAL